MTMTSLPMLEHALDRTVVIQAEPRIVFRYFTDTPRWAKWWGEGSEIDARPGGRMLIRYPGGVEVSGEVLEVDAPKRIVFTYGFVSGTPIPVGSSRVTIRLEPHAAGTRVQLRHEFSEPGVRDDHVQGWRFQLSLFSNVVADEMATDAASLIDTWFDAWAETDTQARTRTLQRIASADLRFHDRYSNTDSLEELVPHISASQRFMPGFRLRRAGDVRHCQGMVLADWVASGPDGAERMRGVNVFVFGPTGLIEWVTGFAG